MKRLTICVFLLASIVVSAAPERATVSPRFADWMKGGRSGLPPSPVSWGFGRAAKSPRKLLFAANGQESRWDSREHGWVSPIKDQKSYGTCWAHAAMACLETRCLMRDASVTNDFSENHMASHRVGFELGFDDGGNNDIATALLVSGRDPINEVDDPYPNPYSGAIFPAVKHVREARILPGREGPTDNGALKEAVKTYGAVSVSYYHDGQYLNTETSAYRYTGGSAGNHAVTLIGWDDDYPAENFKSDVRPSSNGAFLVKNSWGDYAGNGMTNGCLWISYEDAAFCKGSSTVYSRVEDTTDYGLVYQYDPCGMTATFRSSLTADRNHCANMFVSTHTGAVASVGFYVGAAGLKAQISVYVGCASGQPTSGSNAVDRLEVTADFAGYMSVALPSLVPIERIGERFSVVLHVLESPNSAYPLPVEVPIGGYCTTTASFGQSYYSTDGASWTDLNAGKTNPTDNFCIKAYTAWGRDGQPARDPTVIYVDGSATGGDADGSEDHPFPSIAEALTLVQTDDIVLVAPGRYAGPVAVYDTAPGVTILASDGPEVTFIDGGFQTGCYFANGNYDVLLSGFTLENGVNFGGVFKGVASNCVIRTCESTVRNLYDYLGGGGAYRSYLFDCVLYGNAACYGGGAAYSVLEHCTVFGNSAFSGSGVDYTCKCYNSIMWGNWNFDGLLDNWERIGQGFETHFEYCCTYPSSGWYDQRQNVFADPKCVSLQNADWRLRSGSPCIGKAYDGANMGADRGVPVEGFVIETDVIGVGTVTPTYAVVPEGGTASFSAASDHPFVGFFTNGVFVANDADYAWPSVRADGTLSVAFERLDLHVDAANGDDGNDGRAPDRAKRTLQAAVDLCGAGDSVSVAPGTYAGITPRAGGFTVTAEKGPTETAIDGGWTNRCLNSPDLDVSLVGFTLRRGVASLNFGGGAFGGILSHCVISNCEAGAGGGAAFAVLSNCLVVANRAGVFSVADNLGLGGGLCDCHPYNCTVAGNRALNFGGGAFLDEEYVAHNTVVAANVCDKGYDNGNDIYGMGYWVTVCSLSDRDAKFVDAARGDYRLTARSPCIDTGSNVFATAQLDLAGTNRIVGARVDMGCFEYTPPVTDWPSAVVAPGASAEEEAQAVAVAMAAAGFADARASALSTLAQYDMFTAWADAHGHSPRDMIGSKTSFLSSALDADGLLDDRADEIRIGEFGLPADGSWKMSLDLPDYDEAKVDSSLLRAAVGVVGAEKADGKYGELDASVSAGTGCAVITGSVPDAQDSLFLKATVR